MITNLKTQTKSTRQKRQETMKKKTWAKFVRNFDAYVKEIENSNDAKIKRIAELGKKHMQMKDIYEIIEKEFPEE